MKILTVVFDLGKGGTQRAAQNFCEGYACLGHDSRMMAVDADGFRRQELLKEGITVWVGKDECVLTEISSWKPDVIHLHSIGLTSQLVSTLKKMCNNARFVETNIFSELSTFTEFIDYSFQLSEWCVYNYLSRGGVRSKCVIVPNPVKTQSFYKVDFADQTAFKKKYSIPENVFLFGRIGQDLLDKWSYYLIDVFKIFCETVSDNCLLLVVNPPRRIVEYARSEGIVGKLVIIDEIIGDLELRSCYSSIDIFLHVANQGESFGLVLAESLLCETPVVALNTPWSDNSQAEVVGNEKGGYCVNSPQEFLSCMRRLYNDPVLRSSMGKKGRAHILGRYEYRTVAAKSLKLLSGATIDQSYFKLPVFKNLESEGIKYNPMIRLLLQLKLKWFGKQPHGSRAHRSINLLIRLFSSYRKGRRF